jgi:hypothetical protein
MNDRSNRKPESDYVEDVPRVNGVVGSQIKLGKERFEVNDDKKSYTTTVLMAASESISLGDQSSYCEDIAQHTD